MKIRTSDFQVAKIVPIEDGGGLYTGVNVETALQEIGDGTTLDPRYVKLDASNDPITGGLTIEPDTDTLTALVVNDTDSNNVFTVDTVNNRVGIGTTAPTELLHLSSTGNINLLIEADTDNATETDNAGITLSQDGGAVIAHLGFENNRNSLEIVNEYADALTLGTSGIERMRINSTGNVGIGTTTPRAKTHIWTGEVGAGAQEALRLQGNWVSNPSGPMIAFTNQHDSGTNPNTGEYNLARIAALDDSGSWGGSLRFQTTPSGTTGGGTPLDRMTIRYDGNVGIGTTSPSSKLHVKGSADDQQLIVQAHSTQTANISEIQLSDGTKTGGWDKVGTLFMKETTTPTATTNYGKVYTKSDNKLYFQDGAGTEHEIAFV